MLLVSIFGLIGAVRHQQVILFFVSFILVFFAINVYVHVYQLYVNVCVCTAFVCKSVSIITVQNNMHLTHAQIGQDAETLLTSFHFVLEYRYLMGDITNN